MSWTNWYLPIGCPNVSRSRAYSTERSRQARITPHAPAATVKRPWSSPYIAISKPWPSSPIRFSAGTSTFWKKSSPVEPAQTPSLFSVSAVVKPALLLLLACVAEERERVQADVDGDERPERGLATLDLLTGERLGDEVEPGAAVLLRDRDPEDAELGHALDRAHVEVVRDVVLDRVREDPVLDEPPDGVLEQPLLVGELEVHARQSTATAQGRLPERGPSRARSRRGQARSRAASRP